MMQIQTIMEYRCGHPERVIATGELNPRQSLREQLVQYTDSIPKRADGKIDCLCSKCHRGAGWIVLKVNGEVISRESVDDLVRRDAQLLEGAEVSLEPDANLN